jgi:hypothetical protein
MAVYSGPLDDSHQLIQFLRRETSQLRTLRRLVVSRDKTVVMDVNGDTIEFPGLTYGCGSLDEILRELGVVFTPSVLHNANATPDGVKEFRLSARHPWGEDRVM